jgi:hypothetical protein
MDARTLPMPRREHVGWDWLILGLSLALASWAAVPYAGSWNDGSRLATVEALVDFHTWAIDDSIFVAVPANDCPQPFPYYRLAGSLHHPGTKDKLFIAGHYYSDKSPVPGLLLAGEYWLWQKWTGCTAAEHADRFCRAMTVGSSGLAYVLAVWCLYRLGRPLGLNLPLRLALTASLALCTLAVPYMRAVNNHILLLAVAMALLVELAWLRYGPSYQTPARLLALGCLAGLGYTIDLGAGPLICAGAGLAVLLHCHQRARGVRGVAWFTLAALPWLGLHHGLNYMIGGHWKPANAFPEHFLWPGSPFTAQNMTGGWNHESVTHFVSYALGLLGGNRGFLLHNLPLWLLAPALWLLLRQRLAERLDLWLTAGSSVSIWLVYAVCSTNGGGGCTSVRWFLPLLAPGYYVLAVFLREYPNRLAEFGVLNAVGLIMAAVMFREGPWMLHMVPYYWVMVGVGVVGWVVSMLVRRRTERAAVAEEGIRQLPPQRRAA